MDSNRRAFLKSTLLGAGAVGTDAVWDPQTDIRADTATEPMKNPFSTDPVALRSLTDRVSVTRIGFGTGVSGGNRQSNLTRMDRTKAIDLVRYAYDCGIRFFDMADMYGTHQIVREALAGKPRDSYALLTKIWGHKGGIPEEERPTADLLFPRFKEELGTDYIDVIQIHCMTTGDWLAQFDCYFESLEKLKSDGLIGAHGVSCHALAAVETAAVQPWVDTIHIRMNTVDARMEGTLAENQAAALKAHRNGKGIIVMKVLGEGSIKDAEERKKSIRMVTGFEATDAMVVGFESREQVDEFITNVQTALNEMAQER